MRLLCSHCHTVFQEDPEEQHKACPNCKVEAGLEPIKDGTPQAMQLFRAILLAIALFAIGGSVVSLLP